MKDTEEKVGRTIGRARWYRRLVDAVKKTEMTGVIEEAGDKER